MTDSIVERPAEPVGMGTTYGGFADIARRLNALHPERPIPFSRQLAAKWWKHRDTNGFPERLPVEVGVGKVKDLFDLDAVERWHSGRPVTARPAVSGDEGFIDTIPLFQVDSRGVWTPLAS
jgi:hypothetical protein